MASICTPFLFYEKFFFSRYVTPTGLAVHLVERDTYTPAPRVVGPTCVTQTVCCFIIYRLI